MIRRSAPALLRSLAVLGLLVLLGRPASAAPSDEPTTRELLAVASSDPSEARRAEAWRLVGVIGRAEEIPAILEAFPENRFTEKADAEAALVRCLRRWDPDGAYLRLAHALTDLPPGARARVIGCVGKAGSPRGARLLRDLLDTATDLKPTILSALAGMPEGAVDEELLSDVAGLLDWEDGLSLKTVAFALGRSRSPEVVERLVAKLGDCPPDARDTIFWTLRRATGVELPADERRWGAWLADEKRWWRDEGRDLLADLGSPVTPVALAALYALTGRPRLHGAEIDRGIEPLLADDRGVVRKAAREVWTARGGELPETAPVFPPRPRPRAPGAAAPRVRAPADPPIRLGALLGVAGILLLSACLAGVPLLVRRVLRARNAKSLVSVTLDPRRRRMLLRAERDR